MRLPLPSRNNTHAARLCLFSESRFSSFFFCQNITVRRTMPWKLKDPYIPFCVYNLGVPPCQDKKMRLLSTNRIVRFFCSSKGSFLRTGGEQRMFASLAIYSCAGVIHSHSPAALAEHGGKWLWVTPLGYAALLVVISMSFPCLS